jgi:hypothetical protein
MQDRPDAATLLRGMAATLTDEVLPTTSGPAKHAVRVVANLCRILERETRLGAGQAEETRRALAELLDHEGTLSELVSELDHRLRDDATSASDAFAARARRVILADVERRLAIDQPGYAS